MKTADNRSGFAGVGYLTKLDVYVARVIIDGKRKQIGTFKTALEAATFRDEYIKENEIAFSRKPRSIEHKNKLAKNLSARKSNILNKTIYTCERKGCYNLNMVYTSVYVQTKNHFCSTKCKNEAGYSARGAKARIGIGVKERIENYFKEVNYG